MFEAIVFVVDPAAFVEAAYAARNGVFRAATVIEETCLEGPRTVSSPGGYVSIRSDDRLNVEDVLLVDFDMNQIEADSFIKLR